MNSHHSEKYMKEIPDYPTDGSVSDLWISQTQKISFVDNKDKNVLRNIFMAIYHSHPDQHKYVSAG